ncbi:hypothetical protein BJX65DRAFT_287511 [Aspergillus insuetus]
MLAGKKGNGWDNGRLGHFSGSKKGRRAGDLSPWPWTQRSSKVDFRHGIMGAAILTSGIALRNCPPILDGLSPSRPSQARL